ncbi:MAG TPA: hypothetical protein PLC72_07275 [Candidatus Hydrogenedentes bacterium]|nr:hypothetical protein [Candidatus Hydrogenedentota bacterium]
MNSDSETVMSFQSEMEACLAQSKLASMGIRARVHRFSRYRSLASGGYQLKVARSDLDRARHILNETAGAEIDLDEYISSDDESCPRCPACRSANVDVQPLPLGVSLFAIALLGLPFLFIHRDWSCRKCHAHWRT